ncbi:piggyBac transposable element-derived protein 3-like [Phymastichus coffea]|uniref:piggyBac transposable element-derived protein 3-like n=1 Tax=Phymastichus coffea TaxID=108790 RepID=UPI00273C4A60|nr:piggyBac transposable element-derived protein 3-like [Phymastichus coffea]
MSYRQVLNSYEENQTKLAPNHEYEWIMGEQQYHEIPKNNTLLSDKTKKFLKTLSTVQMYELYFASDLKEYIIKCTNSNVYQLTADKFEIFLGIIITTIFNNRKSQRDYWSSNELFRCNPIASAMSRDKFLKIKRNIKFSESQDENEPDKVWRVRNILNIFRKNISQFGFFFTALFIDEMMVKFHGRAPILQFMPNKPERFGIKMWKICSPEGYLFDLDVYCGQGSNIYSSDNKIS